VGLINFKSLRKYLGFFPITEVVVVVFLEDGFEVDPVEFAVGATVVSVEAF